jgi:ABC-2 type transport system permease protein
LLRHRARRDRIQVLIWLIAIGALVFFAATALEENFGDEGQRIALLRLATANPAILLLRGPPQGADFDALFIFTIFAFLGLLAGLISTFLAVRHSRADEETGRAELIAATPISRLSPLSATILWGVLVNLLLAIVVSGCCLAAGMDASGSWLTGFALGAIGVSFLAVGLVSSELLLTSRAANGIAAGIVLLAYLARGVGDAFGTVSDDGLVVESAWPSWLSPIGWGLATHPFSANNAAPLLLNVGLAVVLTASACALHVTRDSGASVFGAGVGRANARRSLSGSLGLAWRLHWPAVIGWALGAALLGAFGGALGTIAGESDAANPIAEQLRRLSAEGQSLNQAFLSVIFTVIGILAAGCAVQAVIRARQEEAVTTAELVLATPVRRVRWLVDYLVVGGIAVGVVLAASALTAALSAAAVGADDNAAGDALASALAQLPAALLYLGLVALVFVLLPRLTAPLGWALLTAGAFLGLFGRLVGLPEWAENVSPFSHTPVALGSNPDWTGGFVMLGLALLAGVAASALLERRDIAAS